MDFTNTLPGYWTILLLVGIICGVIGYFWGKSRAGRVTARAAQALRGENDQLLAQLAECRGKLQEAGTATAAPPPPRFDAAEARAAMGSRVKENDLKVVDGIGPKIEGLFHNFDIKTWHALADTPVAKCQEVLESGGDRYSLHDPSSWPMQARMAYEGRWKELRKWQDKHAHGKL